VPRSARRRLRCGFVGRAEVPETATGRPRTDTGQAGGRHRVAVEREPTGGRATRPARKGITEQRLGDTPQEWSTASPVLTLPGERILLRDFLPDDRDPLLALESDEAMFTYMKSQWSARGRRFTMCLWHRIAVGSATAPAITHI
jgi:hypothetical protein